ncbi:helix-turn-helix transcriptional regulator [Thioalkalivibrio sp. AKL10]|uniref:helix-turn-helix domain-containing protein n=1 Tax=Thioalkalivibrio sp. AKL10 TaxID=1158158 RepID=UPI0003A1024B|nr:helix-turn-helix transcriptional regulator [Thioalkalivibrio sp. AKL10]
MILLLRLKIKERIADLEFKTGRRITLGEVAKATGINRMTLSKMVNHRGYNAQSENLDKLCRYFDCRIEELVEYIPDEQLAESADQEAD